MLRKLLIAALAVALAGEARADSLTPANLSSASTLADADLLLVWPYASVGPLKSMQWSVLKGLITTEISGGGTFSVSGLGGTLRSFQLQTGGLNRWALSASTDAETGTNAGSNFQLGRYNDVGALVDNALTIDRPTGRISVTDALQLPGAALAAPVNGDAWVTSTDAKVRVNGVTRSVGSVTGSFTPTFVFQTPGTSSWVYTVQAGTYRCEAGWVTVSFRVRGTLTVGTASGVWGIGGLPYSITTMNAGTYGGPLLTLDGTLTGPSGQFAIAGNTTLGSIAILYGVPNAEGFVSAGQLSDGVQYTINGEATYLSSAGVC